MYLTILWFSLNCLSFFELYVQDYIDSLRMKRLFIRLLHLLLEFVFHLAVKLYFPFSFGKTYNLDYLSSSVRFLLKSFFYSIVKDHVPTMSATSLAVRQCLSNSPSGEFCGRSGWTRTIDLALIRRAL